jgi:hypothetical protein
MVYFKDINASVSIQKFLVGLAAYEFPFYVVFNSFKYIPFMFMFLLHQEQWDLNLDIINDLRILFFSFQLLSTRQMSLAIREISQNNALELLCK